MSSDDRTSALIRSAFRSVWSLEVLLLLKGEPRQWSEDEIVSALRASHAVVTQSVAALVSARLILSDKDGRVRYRPPSKAAEKDVDEVEKLYRLAPDAVRRLIIAGPASSLTAFADAFRLRKD